MKRFVFPLGLSIGIHGLILGIVPNPIQSSPSPEIEIIGLTPIVELPVEPPLLNPSKLAVVPPVQDHLSVPPSIYLLGFHRPPMTFPSTYPLTRLSNPAHPNSILRPLLLYRPPQKICPHQLCRKRKSLPLLNLCPV